MLFLPHVLLFFSCSLLKLFVIHYKSIYAGVFLAPSVRSERMAVVCKERVERAFGSFHKFQLLSLGTAAANLSVAPEATIALRCDQFVVHDRANELLHILLVAP